MAETPPLTRPWMVAVWPGMGHVALNAGYYLLAKLGMSAFAEYDAGDLFDVDHVEVEKGVIKSWPRPRNRFFVKHDPKGQHDLVVFLGEAQPPVGKFAFCKQVIAFAKDLGVERVYTFAAMATGMHPTAASRVFAAATDADGVGELADRGLELLKGGQIGGLNGVLLGAAAEAGLRGACLLGEMPHVFARFPFPKASQAILEVFAGIAGVELDLTELAEQTKIVEEQLGELMARAEDGPPDDEDEDDDDEEAEGFQTEESNEEGPAAEDRERIDHLFAEAEKDRSKAFELKRELDRLGVFKEFEDRFLDLFKKAG